MLFLQETKLSRKKEEKAIAIIKATFLDYVVFANTSESKQGYAGTMVLMHKSVKDWMVESVQIGFKGSFSKADPDTPEFRLEEANPDLEGRLQKVTSPDKRVCLFNIYNMNSMFSLRRLEMRMAWDTCLAEYLRQQTNGLYAVVLGDLNALRSLEPKDIHPSRAGPNRNDIPSLTDEERESFAKLIAHANLTFAEERRLLPRTKVSPYTFYADFGSKRKKIGFNLDYALVSSAYLGKVQAQPLDSLGVDHQVVYIELAKP